VIVADTSSARRAGSTHVEDLRVAGDSVTSEPSGVTELAERLSRLGWISDLWVAGSLATGDYVPGVSDLDLVAIADGPVDDGRRRALTSVHRELDQGVAAGSDLGCAYVDGGHLTDVAAAHPTWTHGGLVTRTLSGITRAELALHGYAVIGRPPRTVLAPVSPDDVRRAARAELSGYWREAVRHPWWWLDPIMPDLGLTSMARARHAVSTGQLLGKTRAISEVGAPAWYLAQMRARRRGDVVVSPRLRSALIAWTDARRTVARLGR
jgi:hypothetical protein